MSKRADQILVDLGLFNSRSKAKDAIEEGLVFFRDTLIEKPSQLIEDHVTKDEFKVLSGQSNRFVSRGGLKLEGALNRVSLDVQSFDVLDVGISTGGFTDCLLQREVKSVLGVDVGTRQIHPSLRGQKRLQVLENTHIKDFRTTKKFDLVVVDVSFISLKHVLPHLPSYIKSEGYLLALVKPQFELSAEKLGKGGIVKDSSHFSLVENSLKKLAAELGFDVLDYFESPIQGKDGNREFFIYAKKRNSRNRDS